MPAGKSDPFARFLLLQFASRYAPPSLAVLDRAFRLPLIPIAMPAAGRHGASVDPFNLIRW